MSAQRWRVSGTIAERLAAKSERAPSGCLVWAGPVKPNGYARLVVDGREMYAHRAAYELAHGAIPDDMTVDHLCRTRSCIEPSHLAAVTRGENTRRATVKTHCIRGHELTGDTIRWKRRGPYLVRDCRDCDALRARERHRQANPLAEHRALTPAVRRYRHTGARTDPG